MRKPWVPTLIMELDGQRHEWKAPLAAEVEHIGKLVEDKTTDLSDIVFRAGAGQPAYMRAVWFVLLKRAGVPQPFEHIDFPVNDAEVYLVDESGREVGFDVVPLPCGVHAQVPPKTINDECPRCGQNYGPETADGAYTWRYEDDHTLVPTKRASRSVTAATPSATSSSSFSGSASGTPPTGE